MNLLNKILKYEKVFYYLISILFIVAFMYFSITKNFHFFSIISIALLFIFIAIYAYDKFLMIVAIITPFSLQLSDLFMDMGLDLSLPTEPILILLTIIFILKLSLNPILNKKLIFHPITLTIFFSLFWIFITTLTSSLPIISIKFLIMRIWFIIPCFFIANQIFKDYTKIKLFIILYTIGLSLIIVYSTFNHLSSGFSNSNAAHFVMRPFYNDHTAYGAVVSLFLPVIFGLVFNSEYKRNIKLALSVLLILLILALILSYSRAAWLSIIGAIGIIIIVKLKIKFKYILTVLIILISLFFTFQNTILDKMSKNNQDSSNNLGEQIRSITNISTDASNLERLNRWNSAFKMFNERPIFGWGPGTYSFQYAPFQKHSDKTIISTNFGNVGNAHSEYIGPLAETGIIGTISFILIAIFTIITGIKNYRIATNKEIKMLSISITLGLITYFFHGTLNNFLDTDKLSVPFWSFISIIVAIDIYHKQKNTIKQSLT